VSKLRTEAWPFFPSPRVLGEGGEQRGCEPGEGALRFLRKWQLPLTRLARAMRSQVDLSPQAGRGEEVGSLS